MAAHVPPILLAPPEPVLRWQSPWMLPAAAAAALVLTVAVFWLYPAQVKAVRRPWRWVLPGLRVVALLALSLSFARPIALRTRAADERGPVLVLVDRSRSMGVADAGRKKEDLVSLAGALGLLPAGARNEQTARWLRDLDALQPAYQQVVRAQGELDYARLSGRGIGQAEARLRDAGEQFAALAHALAESAGATGDKPQPRPEPKPAAGKDRPKTQPTAPGKDGDKPPAPAAPAPPVAPPDVRERLRLLDALPRPTGRAGWAAEAERKMRDAATALNGFQAVADRRLFDTNAEVARVCEGLDKRSRLGLSEDALLAPGAGLVARLGGKAPAVGFAFAQDVVPLGTLRPRPPGPPPDSAGGISPGTTGTQPDGRLTDLSGAVAAVLARTEGQGVRAVVVFTDGRQVGPEGASAASLTATGVPVFTIGVAPDVPVRDVSIADVDLPGRGAAAGSAFVGETITVTAGLRGGAMGVDPGAARLQVDDGPERPPDRTSDGRDGRRDKKDGRAGDGRADEPRRLAEFSLKADEPGVHLLTVSVPPVEGEATAENNRVQRWVKVLPEKIRVAAYAGAGGWDFQYLRSALGRMEFVSLDAGVLGTAGPKLPLTPQQILRQDVIILADVPVDALDGNQWDAVHRLATRRGGSVIFLAGPAAAVTTYDSQPLAAALMPFPLTAKPVWRVWPGERPNFRLVPGPGFERSPALRLEDGDTANRRWEELPGLFRVMPVTQLNPNASTRALLVEPELHAAVLTETQFGPGRAFFLGTDETWRWRFKSREHDQERFWRQLVRYAAEEPYAAREGGLALDADKVSAAPGEAVQVRARVLDPDLESNAAGLRLEVVRDVKAAGAKDEPAGGSQNVPAPTTGPTTAASQTRVPAPVIRSQPLTETVPGGGRFRATLDGLPEGDYLVRLVNPALAGDARPVQVPLHVSTSYEAELRDVAPDYARLRRLAESTGGQLLRLDQVGTLPDRLTEVADNRPRVTELRLWDSPWLFAFVLACLAAEWALRKRMGLA